MLKDWDKELNERTAFIRKCMADANANGIVYGNSGGKDSALVGILCRRATPNVKSLIMPCGSSRNYGIDREHALLMAEKFDIDTVEVDLTPVKELFVKTLTPVHELLGNASININPRLRMITLYCMAQSLGYLVAGTGNRSEAIMGYFTKWGDGAHDINPIADLTVTEIYDFLRFLGAPQVIIDKAPSAGLFEGQTDEGEMGITYATIDKYLLYGEGTPEDIAKIEGSFSKSAHKRSMPIAYSNKA